MKSTIKPGISAAAILAGLLAQHGAATAQTTAPAATDDSSTVFIVGRIDSGITASDGETPSSTATSGMRWCRSPSPSPRPSAR